jgi:thiopeptide-type bacteriocin biosynthesis protein
VTSWTSLHCRLSWRGEDVDAFVADALAPALTGDWFFLRYWKTGPHLRIRLRDADPVATAATLRTLVAGADFAELAVDPDEYYASVQAPRQIWHPHGEVREVPYVPETERYGGPELLPVAEDVFCRSTEVAVAVLRAARTPSAKLSAAVELVMATTAALGMDRPAAAAWLRTMGTSWRHTSEPASPPTISSHVAANRLHAARAPELARRWDRVDTAPTGAVAYWMDQVRAVDLPRYVWLSQLHMLLNRLGIGPDEERTICWLVAATAGSPDGVTPFHEDGARAPDRRYLEASKFLLGAEDQVPRQQVAEPVFAWQRHVELPKPTDPVGSLVTVLRGRRTGLGEELTGPLTASGLATLLWTAQGMLDDGRRPYPSAGAQYSARLRLVALDVDGLAPGCYDVDEERRTLLALGPAPSTSDLANTSMWFGEELTDPARVPALLGLYVRLGALRRTYGLRAMRLAFTEAGHLAQNLALVAAATDLSMGVIGGFYDDVAHDVLGLDGVDDCLVYLLPIG